MAIEIEEWEIWHTYTTYLESTNIDLLESARRLVASGVAECAMLRDGRTYWRSNGMGQRRYVESLSAYARQFLERIEKPDADVIDGIAPAVAIRQKNTTRNPRSTVATATEIYDYLRLLFARIGRTYCLQCGQAVKKDTVDEVASAVLALGEGTRLNVLFPLNASEVRPVETQKKKVRGGKGNATAAID